jgi:hypothetical protein
MKNDGLPRGAVSGKITLNGVALAEGSIVFVPCGDTKGPTTGATIRDGHYSISAEKGPAVGRNRVEISASKRTGRKVRSRDGTMVDESIESVPDRYNIQSTLATEIRSGRNVFDCQLESQ